jgi:hypothetical protein
MKKIRLLLLSLLILIGCTISINAIAVNTSAPQDQTEQNVDADNSADTATDQPAEKPKREKSTDWFSLIIALGYLLGVFILLPIVIYTNHHEKIFSAADNPEKMEVIQASVEERNQKAAQILEKIEAKMGRYTNEEDGEEYITITSGVQSRYTKFGLDYINQHLDPKDEGIKARVAELTEVYNKRTKRSFTGSKYIIGAAIGVVVLMGVIDWTMLFSFFMLLHVAGLIFYYLSSRTPVYALEKRLKTFGSKRLGIAGGVLAGLFAGFGAKSYVSRNGGAWERDYETEGSNAMVLLLIIVFVALIIAFMVALFGIINFVINYSTSFILPNQNAQKWHVKNIA